MNLFQERLSENVPIITAFKQSPGLVFTHKNWS